MRITDFLLTIDYRRLKRYPLPEWGRGFILLLPQAAALPGSDAGSDVIKPLASIEFRHPKPSDLVLHVMPDVRIGHTVRIWSTVC